MTLGNDLEDHSILHITNLAASGLSLLGCLWIVYFYSRAPSPKSAALNLILGIALADLLYTVANFMSAFSYEASSCFCKFEGFIRQISPILSIFMATSTALLCYKNSKEGISFDQNYFFKKAALISFLLSFSLALAPLFLDQVTYTKKSLFCWVNATSIEENQTEDLVVLIIFEGIPLLSGCLITTYGYTRAIRNTKKVLGSYLTSLDFSLYNLLWYPSVLFLIFIPAMADNILQVYVKDTVLAIEIVHLSITHSIGFINAIVYGVQKYTNNAKNEETRVNEKRPSANTDSKISTDSLAENLLKAGVHDF